MKRLRSHLTYSNVMVTVLALIVLGGGTAYAASQLEKESVGTKQLAKEAVTPAKLSKASKKNLTGPQGPVGLQGPAGPTGLQGPRGEKGEPGEAASTMWGVFNADGSLRRGEGVVGTVGSPGVGYERVNFEQPVNECAILASLGRTANGNFASGMIDADEFVANGFNPTEVLVSTLNSAGTTTNEPFHLAIIC